MVLGGARVCSCARRTTCSRTQWSTPLSPRMLRCDHIYLVKWIKRNNLSQVAEDLLAYFLEHKAYDCFAACLFQVWSSVCWKFLQHFNFNLSFSYFSVTTCCILMWSWSWRGNTTSWTLPCPTLSRSQFRLSMTFSFTFEHFAGDEGVHVEGW